LGPSVCHLARLSSPEASWLSKDGVAYSNYGGAGVSKQAGLPLFGELVEYFYRCLGEDWQKHDAEREGMRQGGRMHGEYDRVLRCLERRLAGSDPVALPAMRERIQAAVRKRLEPGISAPTDCHAALLNLSVGPDGRNRLVTTNFDAVFERTRRSLGYERNSSAGNSLPQPGTAGFEGVLHLHGRIPDDDLGLLEAGIILTSAEFGEAYLRSGWAARYVYDLSRAYTLVLVGYAADDPPMCYLLEVLESDRGRFHDLNPIFAIAGTRAGDDILEAAMWAAKGVTLIPYRIDGAGGHGALLETLQSWAAYAADPTAHPRYSLEGAD
jgi:NAD-dependent SIR2 family protein deacetylase